MLHLIYQSPLEPATLQRIACGDSVLFMENAVLRLLKKGDLAVELEKLINTQSLFVLREDIEIRGIAVTELIAGIQLIDYHDFVDLTTEHKLIKTWN